MGGLADRYQPDLGAVHAATTSVPFTSLSNAKLPSCVLAAARQLIQRRSNRERER
jgi:hypothetical protein